MKILPVGKKILVKEVEEKKKSGVLRSEAEEKKRPSKGIVVAVGDEYEGNIKAGDTVYWQMYGLEKFTIDNVDYYSGEVDEFYVVIKK